MKYQNSQFIIVIIRNISQYFGQPMKCCYSYDKIQYMCAVYGFPFNLIVFIGDFSRIIELIDYLDFL